MRLLDLFCGRFGWSRAFAARGWECVGVDLVEPPEIPQGCRFIKADVMSVSLYGDGRRIGALYDVAKNWHAIEPLDFICASSPCEQFSLFRMRHFHPNPPYPELGIKLFNHARSICEASGVPYILENVYAAQQFIGRANHHCGPYYLWGNGVPPIMPQGISKGISQGGDSFTKLTPAERRERRKQYAFLKTQPNSGERKNLTGQAATIPPELASCVADYAERILEQKAVNQ